MCKSEFYEVSEFTDTLFRLIPFFLNVSVTSCKGNKDTTFDFGETMDGVGIEKHNFIFFFEWDANFCPTDTQKATHVLNTKQFCNRAIFPMKTSFGLVGDPLCPDRIMSEIKLDLIQTFGTSFICEIQQSILVKLHELEVSTHLFVMVHH